MRWTEADKKRVRAILDQITADGSQAELARSIGGESRSLVNNWRRRGKVPVEHIPAVIKAAPVGMTITAGQLHPHARIIEQQSK